MIIDCVSFYVERWDSEVWQEMYPAFAIEQLRRVKIVLKVYGEEGTKGR